MEFNKYNMYSLNVETKKMTDAEKRLHEINLIHDYDSISRYLKDMFYGEESEELVMEYPDEDKRIVAKRLNDAIEVFAFERDRQIKAIGWRKQ